MASKSRTELSGYFKTGNKPTQQNFQDLIDSTLNSNDDGIELNGDDLTFKLKGNGKLSIERALTVTGDSALSGSLTVNNTVSLKGSANGTGLSVDAGGNVSIGGTLAVTGNSTLSGSLAVNNNVGIGTNSPQDRLDVAGEIRILTNSNPIRFSSSWSAFPDNATKQAEISNDTSHYKTLMIVGNKSGGGARKVGVWDELTVNGDLIVTNKLTVNNTVSLKGSSNTAGLTVDASGNVSMGGTLAVTGSSTLSGSLTVNNAVYLKGSPNTAGLTVNASGNVSMGGTLTVTSAIVPSAGNTDSQGIIFPQNPGGGGGDKAWIRYYAQQGEQTNLEIGIENDNDDHIILKPSGNVGIGTPTPSSKLEVIGDIRAS